MLLEAPGSPLRPVEPPRPKLPLVPGREIVGEVVRGGTCRCCRLGAESLCDASGLPGCTIDGGYADHVVGDAGYCFPLPIACDGEAAAPLLRAGLIGHRSLTMAVEVRHLGIYGFGAAAHKAVQRQAGHVSRAASARAR